MLVGFCTTALYKLSSVFKSGDFVDFTEPKCINLIKNISIDKCWLETISNSSSDEIANCQNRIKTSVSTWLDKSLILENSSSLREKLVLSKVNELIFLK